MGKQIIGGPNDWSIARIESALNACRQIIRVEKELYRSGKVSEKMMLNVISIYLERIEELFELWLSKFEMTAESKEFQNVIKSLKIDTL